MATSRILLVGLAGLGLALGCAEREDAAQAELDLVGSWTDTYGEVADIALGSDVLFAAANERAGVLSFRLSDEAAPFPAGGLTGLRDYYAPGDDSYISAHLMADRLLFLKLSTNLLIFDVADPWRPVYLRNLPANGVNEVETVVEDGMAYLYYTDRSDGLTLSSFALDTTAAAEGDRWFFQGELPDGAHRVSLLDYENDGNDIKLSGDLLYMADGRFGLKVFRHVGPRMPMQLDEVSTLRLPGDALRLSVDDGLAAVALGSGGLAVVDVADPSRPRLLSVFRPGGTTLDVELKDGHAYLANSSKGVIVVDLADPELPTPRWQRESGYARRLRLANGRVYVADEEDGLVILADPLGD